MTNIFTVGSFVFSVIFGIVQFLVIVGLIIFGIIKIIKLIKKKHLFKNKKTLVISVVCIIIATLSLIFNMGWFRCIMIWMLIPIIYPILFLVTNLYASQHIGEFPRLKIINFLFIITYLIFWILLPDFGDVGPSYFLFNLVRNDDFVNIALVVSGIAGLAHIVFFVIQIIQFLRIKNRNESN